ncbi:NAS30-like protein, partial [Mya arenaria]
CHTHVGHVNRRADVTIGHGCERKGTIIHELLHSLGFHHEQSRPDRDNYLLYDCVAPDHSGHTSDPHVSLAPTTDPSPSGCFCDWHNSQSDTMDWTHYYIYLEASGHTHKAAYLDSKTYPGGDYCVKFYYHMHGANIETLRLYAVAGGTKHSL